MLYDRMNEIAGISCSLHYQLERHNKNSLIKILSFTLVSFTVLHIPFTVSRVQTSKFCVYTALW